MIYSVFRAGKSYFPQVFLQERNYIIKKKISNYIIDAVENSHEEGSDKESFDEEDSDEEDSGKK